VEEMVNRNYYYLDKISQLEPVLNDCDLPEKVLVNDVTLREAQQIVSLTMQEKIQIAHALDEMGVYQIQIGIPGVSPVDKQTIQQLKSEGLHSRLEAVSFIYLPDWKKDLDACIESGSDSIDMFFPVSQDKLKAKGVTIEQMMETCASAIQYAKTNTSAHLTFCPYPAVRTDFYELVDIIKMSVEAGADMILVADTYGTSSPSAMKYFVKELKKYTSIPLGIHCHDDLGLALANTLAAVEGGAELVEASINGLGDRTGNCCLDEVIIGLTAFYDYDLGIKTEKLYALSKLMEKISHINLAFGKGLVGDNAFVHRHDDDVKSSLALPSSTVPIEPSLVGNKRRFILGGEYTGPFTVKAKAMEIGIDLTDEQVSVALSNVREKLQGRKTHMTDDEFSEIISNIH
jgi:isopropylmalate/homocitrate/citramalate synthase